MPGARQRRASTLPNLPAPAARSLEQRVEALATKALGTRARLVRAFRRGPAGCLGGKAPLKGGAPRPEHQHVLLGVQVGWAGMGRPGACC